MRKEMYKNAVSLKKYRSQSKYFNEWGRLQREREHRDNVVRFINLLSGFLVGKSKEKGFPSSKLHGAVFGKETMIPCESAVSIAVGILPGNIKCNGNKLK